MITNYKSNYTLFSRNTCLTVTDYYLYRHAYSLNESLIFISCTVTL